MNMRSATSLADYLSHITDPDCEYVNGQLVERNVGDISHSDAQGRTYAFILSQSREFWAGVEVRVQLRQDRYRISDVIVIRG